MKGMKRMEVLESDGEGITFSVIVLISAGNIIGCSDSTLLRF